MFLFLLYFPLSPSFLPSPLGRPPPPSPDEALDPPNPPQAGLKWGRTPGPGVFGAPRPPPGHTGFVLGLGGG